MRRRLPPLAHSRSLRASGASHTTGRLPHRSPRLYKHRKMIHVLFNCTMIVFNSVIDGNTFFAFHWGDEFYPLLFLVVDLVPDLIEQNNQFLVRKLAISQRERSSQLQES